MSVEQFVHKVKTLMFTFAVLTLLVQTSFSHSYFLTISQKQHNFFEEYDSLDDLLKPVPSIHNRSRPETLQVRAELREGSDNNSTVIVVTNTVREKSSDLSQTAMDVITFVWYMASFLALAAFFLLMACSDRRCNEELHNRATEDARETNQPITPTPSYSEFAPPSYEAVMNFQHSDKSNIFLVPCPIGATETNNTNDSIDVDCPVLPVATPIFSYYTINELQKLGS